MRYPLLSFSVTLYSVTLKSLWNSQICEFFLKLHVLCEESGSLYQHELRGSPYRQVLTSLSTSTESQYDGLKRNKDPKDPMTNQAVVASSDTTLLQALSSLWSLGTKCLSVNNSRKWGQELCSTHWEPIKTNKHTQAHIKHWDAARTNKHVKRHKKIAYPPSRRQWPHPNNRRKKTRQHLQ